MHIGFDARAAFIDPNRGFGRMARSLAEALLRLHPGEVVLFVPHDAHVPHPWYPLAERIVALRRPRRAAFLFDGPAWRWTLSRVSVDVLHLPAWTIPNRLPVPVVATFCDATPFRHKSPAEPWRRHRARQAIRSLARATAVHAISHHARSELLATVNLREERVVVAHLGVGTPFSPSPTPASPEHILFVGGTDPHKNLDLLLAVMADPLGGRLPPLVVAGPAALVSGAATLSAQGRVRTVTTPDDPSLAALYRRALALVLPSRNEGFGLPALEAMACGCPVVAARSGALPEVCGDAAVLLDPDQPSAWRDALLVLLDEPDRRATLARAGLERARAFTWDRTARELSTIYLAASRAASARS